MISILLFAFAFDSYRAAIVQTVGAKGPSSSDSSYLTMLEANNRAISIVSSGDPIKLGPSSPTTNHTTTSFYFVGMPDGMGAYLLPNDPHKFVVVLNHELGYAQGVVRKHGERGSFTSRLVIDRRTLRVEMAEDFLQSPDQLHLRPDTERRSISRLCSGDMAPPTAFFDQKSKLGTTERIYMTGEEDSLERGFAWIATGDMERHTYELTRMGRSRFENLVASPYEQVQTVVFATDDRSDGVLSVYVGTKSNKGNPIERAGLDNGIVRLLP